MPLYMRFQHSQLHIGFQGTSTSEVIGARNEWIFYDGDDDDIRGWMRPSFVTVRLIPVL